MLTWAIRALRVSSLVTLALVLWGVATTPVGRYWVDASLAETRVALASATRSIDTAWLDATLLGALARTPIDWVLIESATELAVAQGIAPSLEVVEAVRLADEARSGWWGRTANCGRCIAGTAACELGDGLVCTAAAELTPIGDVKALVRQGMNYLGGEEIDHFDVALAGVGLGATALIMATGGASAAVKAGTALLRLARNAGRLTAGLQATVVRIGRTLIDWSRLPPLTSMYRPAAWRAVLNPAAVASGAALATHLGTLNRAVPTPHALRLMERIDDTDDARRVARLAEAGGPRTVAVFHRLGKSKALRLTARLSRSGRMLAGLALALLVQAGLLATALAQRALARGLASARPARA